MVNAYDIRYNILVALAIVGSMLAVYTLSGSSPIGLVIFDMPINDTQTFLTDEISLYCQASSENQIVNVTGQLLAEGYNQTQTRQVQTNHINEAFAFSNLETGTYTFTCDVCTELQCDESQPQIINIELPLPAVAGVIHTTPVINLTFDNPNNPWFDASPLQHTFTTSGNVEHIDRDICKWYGCVDFTSSGGDFLATDTKFTLDEGIALSFWFHPTTRKSHGFFVIEGQTNKYIEEGDYGMNIKFPAEGGEVGASIGSSRRSELQRWTHFFVQYDTTQLRVWKDGVLVHTSEHNKGAIHADIAEAFYLGKAVYGIDTVGYMDEFLAWNRADFTTEQIQEMYEEKREGTPPDVDLYIANIAYELPIDWSTQHNTLIENTIMPIQITIANEGVQDSTHTFTSRLELNGQTIETWQMTLGPRESKTHTIQWPTQMDFHEGMVYIDTTNTIQEDNENNNQQRIYIPYLNRPWYHFNLDEWNDELLPIASNAFYKPANDDYGWARSFTSENFNPSWSGNDVDPRGKKGRENAIGCFLNNYDMSKTSCINAKNHLVGWSNVNPTTFTNVQAIHELIHVGIIFDLMQPTLTEQEHTEIIQGLTDICQHITNLPNTRPDLDPENKIAGDNGWGFGSGMGGFCYTLLGANKNNPTLMQNIAQQYWSPNIVDSWMNREQAYLRGYKNDPFAKYEEGWLYKFYSQVHLVENFWFQKRYGLNNLDEYNNAFCAMARELSTDVVDFNIKGSTLRNDKNQFLRGIQRGDAFSYENPGSGSLVNHAIITYYGLLCDDIDVKRQMLFLRKKTNQNNDDGLAYLDAFLYGQLFNQVGEVPSEIDTITEKFLFDNANDILTIRTNYTYVNDTIIQIDGGEERGNGHSQAQGYFLYALGEPFLDYEQVPYQDDVRAETWKNGISFKNTNQATEGTSGTYSAVCGNAPLNQYYGMGNCPITGTYPDYRKFPLQYGGDIETYMGTPDAKLAGAYVWRPYKNANPVKEYYIKYGDLLVKRTVVTNNLEQNVYHNFININNEFSVTTQNKNIIFTKDNKHLSLDIPYTSVPLTVGGGTTSVQYCFGKTSCSGSYRGLGTYRRIYYHAQTSDIDFLLTHHWYTTNNKQEITLIDNEDKGVQQQNRIIMFDYNNDNIVQTPELEATGWALTADIPKLEFGAFNTTRITHNGVNLLTAQQPLSASLRYDNNKLYVTVNTMERSVGIDYPTQIPITINAVYLENNADLVVQLLDGTIIPSTSQQTEISFTATSTQNSLTYVISGGGAMPSSPIVSLLEPNNQETIYNTEITLSCMATDTNALVDVSLQLLNNTYQTIDQNSGATTHTLSQTLTLPYGTYFWRCVATDDTELTTISPAYRFTLAEELEEPPVVIPPEEPEQPPVIPEEPGVPSEPEEPINQTPPVATSFNGDSTQILSLETYTNVDNFRLENTNHGKIQFLDTVTSLYNIDLDTIVQITDKSITVNSDLAPSLNIPARLSFYNVDENEPQIYRNGELCTVCTDLDVYQGTLTVLVPHFSTYEVVDANPTPTPAPSQTPDAPSSSPSSGGSSSGGSFGNPRVVIDETLEPVIHSEERSATQDRALQTETQEVEIVSQTKEEPSRSPDLETPGLVQPSKQTSEWIAFFSWSNVTLILLSIAVFAGLFSLIQQTLPKHANTIFHKNHPLKSIPQKTPRMGVKRK